MNISTETNELNNIYERFNLVITCKKQKQIQILFFVFDTRYTDSIEASNIGMERVITFDSTL
jgi:hypothetical protein